MNVFEMRTEQELFAAVSPYMASGFKLVEIHKTDSSLYSDCFTLRRGRETRIIQQYLKDGYTEILAVNEFVVMTNKEKELLEQINAIVC